MSNRTFILTTFIIVSLSTVVAQPTGQMPMARQEVQQTTDDITQGLPDNIQSLIRADVNVMNADIVTLLNNKANEYEGEGSRGLTADLLSGGVSAIIEVIGEELFSLAKIRSKQKQTWQQMRQKECTFIDSINAIEGSKDFYNMPSTIGPLDPRNMNFDGITLSAQRDGKEMFTLVCHIDTTRIDHLFRHSKFYLVADTIIFYPYLSFLPNLQANRILQPGIATQQKNKNKKNKKNKTAAQKSHQQSDATEPMNLTQHNRPNDEQAHTSKKRTMKQKRLEEYYDTINQFHFHDKAGLTINVTIDIYSSWINELVQVYKDVKLGSFSIDIPINQNSLIADEFGDSVFVYTRDGNTQQNININGDSFIVPRSYMPGAANNPSWGTGEYKIKISLSQKCQYDPDDSRARSWHKDYKNLMRLQNNGSAKNEYWQHICTTFRESGNTIIKAVYNSAAELATEKVGLSNGNGGGPGGNMQGQPH